MIVSLLNRYQPDWLEQVRLGAPLHIDATGQAALMMQGQWNVGAVFVQLLTKIDEAGTHGDSPYMTMAGYAARLNQWNRFDHKWKKALKKAGLDYFHVKEHGDTPFALKAVKIADDNLMFGFVVRLDKADFESVYRVGGWGGKAQADSMYGLCFRYCLSVVYQTALEDIPHDGLVLNFIVEDGHPNCGSAAEIVRTLKKNPIGNISQFLGYAITGEKKKHPGLQAADGLASGAWHSEALGTPVLGPPRPPSVKNFEPHKSDMKIPLFRCHIDSQEMKTFKNGYFQHLELRTSYWRNRKPTRLDEGDGSQERSS